MSEFEFDKYVKSLLHDAEEEVSPRVWEGITAVLTRKRRRALAWRMGAVSLTAAAAVAVFIVNHSNPSISTVVTPSATALVMEETSRPVLQTEAQPSFTEAVVETRGTAVHRKAQAIPAAPVAALVQQPEVKTALLPRKNAVPAHSLRGQLEDNQLLYQLARNERKNATDRGLLAFTASGNFQGNERGQVSGNIFRRPFSAPPVSAGEGIYNEMPETNFRLPFSIGLGIRYNFTARWAVGSGLRYTNLGRTFVADFVSRDGIVIPRTDIDNQQHWLGIPLSLYYDFVNTGRWRVHGFVGGAADFLAVNDFLVHYSPKDMHYYQHGTSPQWSAAVGLGVEFRISPRLGIYMDPNFRYYFNSERQPRSLRTIQPLRFDLEAGLRLSFGR